MLAGEDTPRRVLAALILAGFICFQLLLAAGLPHGHYAWGGAYQILPRSLWVLAAFFGIGILMNAISRSEKERRMAFVAAALSALCATVALGL